MADEFQTSRSSDDTSSEWIRTELESVDIGDKRLNARVLRVIDTFWKQPQASIPKATGSWSEFKAAYRLLNNPKVTAEKILAPHRESVRSRMEGHRVVLAVQDTTDLNFTSHPATEGLGTIGSSPTLKGMHVHTTVAVTPERVPDRGAPASDRGWLAQMPGARLAGRVANPVPDGNGARGAQPALRRRVRRLRVESPLLLRTPHDPTPGEATNAE
jgi:hypothetical protein